MRNERNANRKGTGDVPPNGEGLSAGQELRPGEEMRCGGEVRHNGWCEEEDRERWLHERVPSSSAPAVTAAMAASLHGLTRGKQREYSGTNLACQHTHEHTQAHA